MTIRWYDQKNLHECEWGESENQQYARKFLTPFIENGTAKYIANVNTRVGILTVDELVLPVTVNDAEYGNSYVVSPFDQYITYTKEELYLIKNPLLESILGGFLSGFGSLLRLLSINKVVIVNNWMVSTNLYPYIKREQLAQIKAFLLKKFPDHAIIFRSVEDYRNQSLFESLTQMGFHMLISRQIFLMDTSQRINSRARYNLGKDEKILAHTPYQVVEHGEILADDMQRILDNYNALYLEKYSPNNPQFTDEFFHLAHKERLLQMKLLKKDGHVDAILGYFHRDGVMTTPLFGYDTRLPKEWGLYRMISLLLLYDARKYGYLLHASSGAAEFKKSRGALESFEYNAVYLNHLPWVRKLPWRLLKSLLEKVAKPLVQKYSR
ncbi:GNAT family N-acetyltransferase [Brevibacillus sp. SYSU BS000544]|uniref:GNAT family N-acetyltransferase n=1 Tax=Brevibacillus sp. SYSU BS000544 TaxID=3416443 RepID=UPI003CE4DD01